MATFAELITQAKTLVPPKLTDDDPLMETAWNKLIDLMTHYNSQILTKLDSLIPPVGFIYIQLPGTPDPAALWDNPDSRWENVSSRFPGAFFRAEGGAASAFNASSTSPAFAAGDSGTTGGQSSGAPNITGAFKPVLSSMVNGAAALLPELFMLPAVLHKVSTERQAPIKVIQNHYLTRPEAALSMVPLRRKSVPKTSPSASGAEKHKRRCGTSSA